jgi:cell division protein FtsA
MVIAQHAVGSHTGELFCALDVGTSKVCALMAKVDDKGQLTVVGAGRVPSQGLRKGVVVSTSEATACIGKAIDEAERTSSLTMESAFVSISGAHISAIGSKGVVDLGKNGRRVALEDCQKALDQAGGIALPHNREVINVVARQYRLDDKEGVDNPIGSTGYRLEVEATVTTGAASNILNLSNCVLDNGVRIQDMVVEPFASAEAVLTKDELKSGVVLVDIGAGTTDVAIYMDKAPWQTHCLEIGGEYLVYDVSSVLRMSQDSAESLIRQFGHAVPERVAIDAEVRAGAFGQEGQQVVRRRVLSEIINARAEELTDLILSEVKRSGYDGLTPAGVVLTGGVAQLPGLGDLSAARMRWPVRIGQPNGAVQSTFDLSSPEYAAAVGLLLWGLRRGTKPRNLEPTKPGVRKRVLEYLKGFLPIS